MKRIAEKLRSLRLERNLSQQYVADSLNVSVATISRIENNPAEAKLFQLSRLAEFYHITLGKIFSNDENELTEALSKISICAKLPFSMSSEFLFHIANELRKLEQQKENNAYASNYIRK